MWARDEYGNPLDVRLCGGQGFKVSDDLSADEVKAGEAPKAGPAESKKGSDDIAAQIKKEYPSARQSKKDGKWYVKQGGKWMEIEI